MIAVRCRAGTYLAIIVVGSSGCERNPAGSNAPTLSVDTINGVVVTHNLARDTANAPHYSIREFWRAGGLDAPEAAQFTGPEMVATFTPTNDVAVLDEAQAQIIVLDGASGEVLRRFGGPGLGPGELSAPGGMGWDSSGRLWVAHKFNGRYTLFSESGGFLSTLPRVRGGVNRQPFPIAFGPDGTVLDHHRGYPNVVFVRVDSVGSVLDSLPVRHPELDLFGGGIMPRGVGSVAWMRPLLLWDFASDASAIWLMRGDSLTLVQITPQGDTLRRVTTSHRVREFSRSQLEAIAAANRALGRDGRFTPVVASSIHVLNDGRVLVQIANDKNEPSAVFDVFDQDGLWMGTLHTPLPVHRWVEIGSRGDTLLLPTVGELDVPIIIKGIIVENR